MAFRFDYYKQSRDKCSPGELFILVCESVVLAVDILPSRELQATGT